jgi:MarR family transcriptional regulator, organic hydroperoxide resistance regulator
MKSDDRLIYILSMAKQTLTDYTNSSLSKAGVKVTIAQAGILILLQQKDRRNMSELGQIFKIDKSAVTHLIDRLEKNGFVERQVQEGNRRAFLIHITPSGLKEAERAIKITRDVNEEVKICFTSQEVESFKKVLNGILGKFKPSK